MNHLNEYLHMLSENKHTSPFQIDKIRNIIETFEKWYEDYSEYNIQSASVYVIRSESGADILHRYKRWLLFKHYIDHDNNQKARYRDYLYNKDCIYIDSHGAMWT